MKKVTLILALALCSIVALGQNQWQTEKHPDTTNQKTLIDTGGFLHGQEFDSTATIALSAHSLKLTAAYDYKVYKVNWSKVKTMSDLKKILEAFNLTIINPDQNRKLKSIKKYLIEQK